MLRRNIALAASGGNSQFVGWKLAEFPNLGDHRLVNRLEFHHFPDWHASCSLRGRYCQRSLNMDAQEDRIALPLRSHTIFGVCEAIGEDFAFNPVLLRVPFAATVLWSPMIAIGAYLAVGLIVLASRLLFPERKASQAPAVSVSPANEQVGMAKAA